MAASREELLSVHLKYEFQMLRYTHERLAAWNTPPNSKSNAYIKSFSVHARNLIEFFELRKPKKDYVGAFMFTAPEYEPMAKTTVSASLRGKLNNQIAHLTFARTDMDAEKIGNMDRASLTRILRAERDRFISQLLPQYQAFRSMLAGL